MSIISEYLSNIELGDINTYKNMTTINLNGMEFPELEYSTLKEGLENGFIEITEIDEGGSVPTLNIINNGDLPVFLFDGEELKGAKQNRVLNTSILIPEHSKEEIPVSCTEQGRWSYNSPTFEASELISSPNIRRDKSASVSLSLNEKNSYVSDQIKVWDNVEEERSRRNIHSSTGALSDIFEAVQPDLNNYAKEFQYNNQNGVLIFINEKIEGMELLSSSENYEKYHEKIIKSYSFDASGDIQNHNNGNIKKDNSYYLKEAKDFLNEIISIEPLEKPSVGYGYDNRFVNENIAGAILVHENAIVHGAFFKKIQETFGDEEEIVSASRRASNYSNSY